MDCCNLLRYREIRSDIMSDGRKDDEGKPDFTFLPVQALTEVVGVLQLGAKKYGRDNWRKVPNAKQRYIAALLRHAMALVGGEEKDPETGFTHAAHIACNALFLSEFNN